MKALIDMQPLKQKVPAIVFFGIVIAFGYLAQHNGIGLGQPLVYAAVLFAVIDLVPLKPIIWIRSNLAFGPSGLYVFLGCFASIVGGFWLVQ